MASSANYGSVNRECVVSEHTLVLSFVFLGLPFFDMVNGFLVVRGFLPEGGLGSPSQLGRLIATFILLYFNRKHAFSPVWIALFFLLVILESLASIRSNRVSGALFGYMTVFRFLYLYLLFLTLRRYLVKDLSLIGKYLKLNVNFISASIVFAFVTGLGNSTYGWGAGTKGFFASGNGLGIYLGVATISLAAMRHYGVYRQIGIASFILPLAAIIMVGSKTAFILAVAMTLIMVWQSRFRILILPVLSITIWYFIDEISNVITIVFDIIIIRYQNSPSIAAYIFSGRDNYVQGAFDVINDQKVGLGRWLFGGGAYLSFQNPAWDVEYDTLETDPFDILFMYGFFGLSVYIFALVYCIWIYIRYPYFLIAVTALIFHSVLAGHVVFNGMSSTLLVVFLVLGAVQHKKRQEQTWVQTIKKTGLSQI